jgi:hypothetical protein
MASAEQQQAGGSPTAAGMDVATALTIVASHYKSRSTRKEKVKKKKKGSKRHKKQKKGKHKR